jgi:redox-sensitive bicupin YhaK (pirin superfamily)
MHRKDLAVIKSSFPLGLHYPTFEPFLFCAHHLDLYPHGNKTFGPDARLLAGRELGMDFQARDGFRMYHGDVVPGFPVHPHRGFETITLIRRGFVDHSDSLGAAGRYATGDVQWLTAGAGIQHSEMFPLLHRDRENTCELFQIWLNLPKRSKMAKPHFTMFWSEDIPRLELDEGRVVVTIIAGDYGQTKALLPPPESWAADPKNEVLVLLVKIKKTGVFRLPKAKTQAHRALYFFAGSDLELHGEINNETISSRISADARSDREQKTASVREPCGLLVDEKIDLQTRASGDDVELLVLQARPIGEPIVQQGPFVMNSRDEILQTINDYRSTQFGGWPWPRHDMVHGEALERFARYPDGRVERRPVTEQ